VVTAVISGEVNQPEHKADNSSPSSTEVKNEWSCTSTIFMCLHDGDTEKFNIFLFPSTSKSVKCYLPLIICSMHYVCLGPPNRTNAKSHTKLMFLEVIRDVTPYCVLLPNSVSNTINN